MKMAKSSRGNKYLKKIYSTDIIQYKDRGKLIKDFFLVFDKSY